MNTASSQAKQAVLAASVIDRGHFVFAAGNHATVKLEMDHLWEHPPQLATILSLLAKAEGLPPADAILGVPTGGQRLANALGKKLHLPVVQLERVPGGAKQDFRFVSAADKILAKSARSPRIYEDVVTTLSSVAGVVKLLNPAAQNIHALAIWLGGEVQPEYAHGVTPHFLVEEPMPSGPAGTCPACNPALSPAL